MVAAIWLRARLASVPFIPPPVHTDAEVRAWFREAVLQQQEVWVADADGEPVAVLVLDHGWIEQLYVEPTLTGHGIGGALLRVAKDRFPAGLELWTFESNGRARRFYERHGFLAVDRTPGDNEEGAPDIRYRWSGRTADSAT